MWGYSGTVHLPTPNLEEKQNVLGHQPTRRPNLGGKEICRDQEVPVGAKTLAPRRRLFSLRCRGEVMPLQDSADRLVAHRIPHILQSPDNAVISPGAILLSELDDQLLYGWIDSWPSWIPPVRGPVKLSREELPVPSQEQLRFDHRHHFRQGLCPKPFAELSQRSTFTVSEPHSSRDLVPHNAVFRDQLVVPQQQVLVHRSCHRGE